MTAAGWPRAATSRCTATATQWAQGRVAATQPMIFSADETTDIGYESGTTVTPDYSARDSRFTGKLHWVQLDVGTDDHDHFIDPTERLRVALARRRRALRARITSSMAARPAGVTEPPDFGEVGT